MNQDSSVNKICSCVFGAIVGGALVFIALHLSPAVCRGVVLKDLTDSAAYTQQLSKAIPQDNKDFLTTLTQGRK